MEYTVQKLARLAGISARTLRFYDEIGLLKPARISTSGYRIYGEKEVDALQQILFFRAMDLDLGTISAVMQDPAFDRLQALRTHLGTLEAKQAQLSLLIDTVQKTIEKEEGSRTMTDQEKFEGFKQSLIDENERQYGQEVRAKYGSAATDESNQRMLRMTKEQYDTMQATGDAILAQLEAAVQAGIPPASEEGRDIALLHKQWLGFTWPQYSMEAHEGLVQMYVDDERFTAYYDRKVPGCARFLRDAVDAWKGTL